MNRTLATSLTTATFLIIAISGIMMFFHFFDDSVKDLHEILGLVFIAAVILHLFYNWKSMKSYFNKKIFYSTMVVGVIVTTIFVSTSMNEGENPKRLLIESVLKAPTEQSFNLLNVNNPKDKLDKAGIKLEGTTILAIAKSNKISPFEIISILTEK